MSYHNITHEFIWDEEPSYPLYVDEDGLEVVRTVVRKVKRAEDGFTVTDDQLLFTHYVKRPV